MDRPSGGDAVGDMVRLTDQLGAEVRDDGDRRVGRVIDVVVDSGGGEALVTASIVRTPAGPRRLPWDTPDAEPQPPDLGEGELLLRRDVLDTQIVDVRGHRVARVGDVLLTERDDGRMLVAVVDVGLGAVVRRLGLKRWSAHLATELVPWDSIHLTSRRGHLVQLSSPHAALHHLPPDELAHLLARLSTTHAVDVLRHTSGDRAAGALAAGPPHVGQRLLSSMDEQDAAVVLSALPEEHRRHWRHRMAETTVPRRRYRRHRPTKPTTGR